MIKNTGSFPQKPFYYSGQISTANSNYTSPTTPLLLCQAGPDGSAIWGVSITPTATVTTANQMQFFESPDGGTTFNLMPLGAVQATYTMAQTTALPITTPPHPNGVPMGPGNPIILGGVPDYENLSFAQSTLSDLTSYYHGGVTQGSANAQILPYAYNSAGTLLSATPATGTIVDFTAGAALTNTTTTTFQAGAAVSGAAIKRTTATQLSAGDITAGFTYRAVFDGTEWILLIAPRIYFAMGQAQAVVAAVWGAHY